MAAPKTASKITSKVMATKRMKPVVYIVAAIVVILLLYSLYSLFFGNQLSTISNNSTFTLPVNGTKNFKFQNGQSYYALFLKSSSSSSATIYVTGAPLLSKPVVAMVLTSKQSADINPDGSGPATMHITLLSSNQSGAQVSVAAVLPSLNLRPSPGVLIINPVTFYQSSITNNSNTINVVFTSSVSTSSTSTSITTSINSTTSNALVALRLANSTLAGSLMNSYSNLYIKDKACNQSVYNTTFTKYWSAYTPTGAFDFLNASKGTPRNVTKNVVGVQGPLYNVTYSTNSKISQTTGPALVLEFNLTSQLIVKTAFRGAYQGLNYTTLNKTYNFQNSINNFCGAYIPYPGH